MVDSLEEDSSEEERLGKKDSVASLFEDRPEFGEAWEAQEKPNRMNRRRGSLAFFIMLKFTPKRIKA